MERNTSAWSCASLALHCPNLDHGGICCFSIVSTRFWLMSLATLSNLNNIGLIIGAAKKTSYQMVPGLSTNTMLRLPDRVKNAIEKQAWLNSSISLDMLSCYSILHSFILIFLEQFCLWGITVTMTGQSLNSYVLSIFLFRKALYTNVPRCFDNVFIRRHLKKIDILQ